eukprot:TRINITY_DN7436_c0_g1_i1.p1 TRINITY_DN7436_c0_g1~~TRINITY_DN7436_c0_g1_i1.p1  ORF type:complete len:173 (+),score=51.58 TRINITY_DN7436_c0_g1_i1:39-557(+)
MSSKSKSNTKYPKRNVRTNEKITNIIHPESRKAAKIVREEQLKGIKNDRNRLKRKVKLPVVEKISFFKSKIEKETEKASFTYDDAVEWIKEYLSRFDLEIEELEQSKDKKVNRLRDLTLKREEEAELFRTIGYEMPDVRNKRNCRGLRDWVDSPNNIQQIEMFAFKDTTFKK